MENINQLEALTDYLIVLMPMVLLDIGLIVFSTVKIFKDGVQNLNKGAWLAIVILLNLLGPILFLLLGRRRDNYDSY